MQQIAKFIDHTALESDITEKKIRQLCVEAKKYGFASVCVNPCRVELCAKLLRGTKIKVCAVIGFPLGANLTETKVQEACLSVASGASELDMVMNIGALRSGNYRSVERDIRLVRMAVPDVVLKVILETCLLTRDEKIKACRIAKKAKADFVKTSTGFSSGGATVEDIVLMRKIVGNKMGVKASGGIKDLKIARAMLKAGADRLGCSASVNIVLGKISDGKTGY